MTVNYLSVISDVAEILTAVFAAGASTWYFGQRRCRHTRLEKYLVKKRKASELPGGEGSGAQSIVHLMGHCSMTEAQVLEAAFGNKNIKTWVAADPDTHRADTLMFRIDDKAWPLLKNSN